MKWLKHKEIDKSWWDRELDQCENALIYAKSWYLDAVSPNWELAILGNNEGFVPITSSRKWGLISSYLQPLFCQQLGLFFKAGFTIPENLFRHVSRRFKRFQIHQNAGLSLKNAEIRINYILDLHKPYEELVKQYSKDARKNLRRPLDFQISQHELDDARFNRLITTYDSLYGQKEKFDSKKSNLLKRLLFSAKENGALMYFEVNGENNVLLFTAAVLKDKKRLYYLFAAPTDTGRTVNITHYFIDYLIRENANEPLILDFEGSMIPSVASFYKKWGGNMEEYFVLKK